MKRLLSTILFTTLASTPALAVDVSKSADVAAPPAKVWEAIGGFCGIGDWHPAVATCTLSEVEGKPRRLLALNGGGEIVEEQVARDDAKMDYTYTIVESPLPVANYQSTIAVTADGEGSRITWTGHFDAKGASEAEAAEVIGGIYDAGIKGISDKAM